MHVEKLEFLSKTLLSMPEKWHGLEDVETRYRQRYLDLIANPEVAQGFRDAQPRSSARCGGNWRARGFIEVETPMMQPLYGGRGGAAVRHASQHARHRSVPAHRAGAVSEAAGGGRLERVYEINRNFRNEGLSTHHNPEFTMLEFYQAYTDYLGLMDFSAELLGQVAHRRDRRDGSGVSRAARSISASCERYHHARSGGRVLAGRGAAHARAGARSGVAEAAFGQSAPPGEALADIFERMVEAAADPADHHLRLSGGDFAAFEEQAGRAAIRGAIRDLHRRAWRSATPTRS